jgi:exodeoxyribonuclease VII large subunit
MERTIVTVAQVNEYLKNMMECDGFLSALWVRGELSNYKIHPSGHHYFTLKDDTSTLRCVIFKSSTLRMRFRPENGMKVLVSGRITVFPRDGSYQMYCVSMTPEGAGELSVAFEQLKERLWKEGLFNQERKKPLPMFPHRIALITAASGAAVRDMIRILGKRYPLSKVLIMSVRVQGPEAPAEIRGAILYANRYRVADLIITGRGGGSAEDLWAFNDERVARAIDASDIPVISAVGHEPDVTISDFVADVRAATPSNAAELAVTDQMELRERLNAYQTKMLRSIQKQMQFSRQQLNVLRKSRVLQSPVSYFQDRRMLLDFQQHKLQTDMKRLIDRNRKNFIALTSRLDAMSPLKVLARGYSLTRNSSGAVVTSAGDLAVGDLIRVTFLNGEVQAQVVDHMEDIQ